VRSAEPNFGDHQEARKARGRKEGRKEGRGKERAKLVRERSVCAVLHQVD